MAGGTYVSAAGARQAFLVEQVGGHWLDARQVPGSAALNIGGDATVESASCAGPGACVIGGYYADGRHRWLPFLAQEVAGSWEPAFEVPGTALLLDRARALGLPMASGIASVSCSAAGECAAAGVVGYASSIDAFGDPAYRGEPFVIDEHAGTWGRAQLLPGGEALNAGRGGAATSLSCAAPRECAVTGYFEDARHSVGTYVDQEVAGRWGRPIAIARLAALSAGGGFAQPSSLTCWSAGDCELTGSYTDASLCGQTYAAGARSGHWSPATTIVVRGESCTGISFGTGGALAQTPGSGVACASNGICELSAVSIDGSDDWTLFATESRGRWSPGTRLLYVAPPLQTMHRNYFVGASLACAGWSTCVIGGSGFTPAGASSLTQAAITPEIGGDWQPTVVVPNSIRLNGGGDATISATSCAPSGYCAIAGFYTTKSQSEDVFVSTATL